MRYLLILLFISFNSFNSFAQEDDEKLSKFYLGIGGGFASKGGNVRTSFNCCDPDRPRQSIYSNVTNGLYLNFLNAGYRINETFGISASFTSSALAIDDGDNYSSSIAFVYTSFGGILSIPTKHFTIDIKPQYAFKVVGTFYGDVLDYNNWYEVKLHGGGFVFSNSIVRSTKKGFTYSLDIDYLTTRFDEARIFGYYRYPGPYNNNQYNALLSDDSHYNSLRVGIGVRYNFRTK